MQMVHKVIGQAMTQFNDLQKNKLLTFYFSDNDKSITGACVEFKFTICDSI